MCPFTPTRSLCPFIPHLSAGLQTDEASRLNLPQDSCTRQQCHALSCMSELHILCSPLPPAGPEARDLQYNEKRSNRGRLGFLLSKSATGENPAMSWEGKTENTWKHTHTHTHTEDSTLDEQGATLQKKLLQSSNISNKIWSFIICSLPEILPLLEDWFA